MATVTPGSKDLYNRELGKTILALSRIEEGLDSDLYAAALDFLQNVTIQDGTTSEKIGQLKSEINNRLVEEVGPKRQRANELYQLQDVLSQVVEQLYMTDAETVGEFADQINIPELVDLLGGVDPAITADSPFNPDQLDKATTSIMQQVVAEYLPLNKEVSELERFAEIFNEARVLSDMSKRVGDFANASNKEEFLKRDYYKSNIEAPALDLKKEFDKNPDNFLNDTAFYKVVKALRSVTNAYTIRTDKDVPSDVLPAAKSLLHTFETVIGPKLNENLNKIAEKHRVVNNNVTAPALNALGLLGKNQKVKDLLDKWLGDNESGSKLKQLIDDVFSDDTKSFDAALILAEHLRKTLEPAQLEQLVESIIAYRDAATAAFAEKAPAITKEKQSVADIVRYISGNFTKQAFYMINVYYRNKQMPDIIVKYLNDLDVESLLGASKYSNISSEEQNFIGNLHEVFYQVTGVNILLSTLQTNFSAVKLKEAKETLEGSLPSLQQNVVLSQIMQFLVADVNLNSFSN